MQISGSVRADPRDRRPGAYSPARRTALVLCGTAAHGAYHAGALRALQEAGIKIDLVAGHGVGACGAALAAIDGGARLWEPDGIWRRPAARMLYAWQPLVRVAGWVAAVLGVVLLIPVLVLAAGLVVYPVGFVLTLLGLDAGASLTAGFSAWLARMFAPEHLPTVVPRAAMAVVAVLALVLGPGALIARWRAPVKRRTGRGWWWQIPGAPLDASAAREAFSDAVWQLIRGAALPGRPAPETLSRRYADVLGESLGQPGFRELIAVATDLDARRDVVVAMVREPYRHDFLTPRPGQDRRADVLDLAGVGRDRALDVIGAALTPPVVCDPALVTFAADSVWRGETHRVTDRPAACSRLLEEVAAAGVSQVIVVSAVASTHEPHRLSAPRLDPRHRLGDFLAAAEGTALRDALEVAKLRFDVVYTIRPAHNPLGPFDIRGVYDESSDRHQDLLELMERGYEDAYRQFIEPIVGASGEQLSVRA